MVLIDIHMNQSLELLLVRFKSHKIDKTWNSVTLAVCIIPAARKILHTAKRHPLIKKGKKGKKGRKSSELQPPDLIPGTCGVHNHDDRLFFLTQAISAENFDFNFRFQ
jgi:hypothetical protein